MALEHTLRRLARTEHPLRKARLRAHILAIIGGEAVRRLRAEMTFDEQMDLRAQILARITRPRTSANILDVRPLLTPTLDFITRLREEVLERIAVFQSPPLWRTWGKRIAIVAALVFLIRITPTFFIAIPLQAVSQNLLIPTTGSVSITEGAQWSSIASEMILDRPLTIRTGNDSAATIVIRDEAVLRFGESTEVTLRSAAFDPSAEGPIARISYGQIWITSLLPEALFAGISVTLPQGTLAMKEGSVSVIADPQQSTVQVFHRFATVLPTGDNPIHLIEGDQLTLLPQNEIQRHLITDHMRTEEWVRINLARDAAHRTEVTDRRQELAQTLAGILPDSAFYFLKLGSEKLDLGMTLSGKIRQEKQLRNAQTRLNEAVALLKAGKADVAEYSLAAYREAIRSFASVSEEEARGLLRSTLVASSTTVASALPHSDLYPAKKAVLEVATEIETTEIPPAQVDLYLLSDALLGMESLIAAGEITKAMLTFNGIEGAVASVLEQQELDGTAVSKDELKAIRTILRSIAFSLDQAEEVVPVEETAMLADLQKRVENRFPSVNPSALALTSHQAAESSPACMTVREVTRRTNSFLAAVYTYKTPRGQRNAVLQQIASLPDCPQSGRILSKVMNKVPVFTRSFVWEALQKIGAGT